MIKRTFDRTKGNRFVILMAIAAALAAMLLASPNAKADTVSGCQVDRGIWLFKGTVRSICDGERRADGSWLRGREFWTPAHYVPVTCYGRYYISCSGGYWQERTSNGVENYIVFDSNVLPDEPGHLENALR